MWQYRAYVMDSVNRARAIITSIIIHHAFAPFHIPHHPNLVSFPFYAISIFLFFNS